MGQRTVGEAPIFMEKAPLFEPLRGNLFKITEQTTGITWIADAGVLAQGIASAAACYRDYRTSQTAEIIPFPLPEDHHAASS